MERKDFIINTAGLLGFNKVYNRANNSHIVDIIEQRIDYCLDFLASTKSFINNKKCVVLTASKLEPIKVETEHGFLELYEYFLPSGFLGYIGDSGNVRNLLGDKLYSDIEPGNGLTLTFRRKCELRDIPQAYFHYFCLELAMMIAPVIGEEKRLSFLSAERTRFAEASAGAVRASKNNNVFGRGSLGRGRGRI